MRIKYLFLPVILVLLAGACSSSDPACKDCGGGPESGYFYRTVTENDAPELGSLGISIDECIQFKFQSDGTSLDLETVNVVDDCCCNQYEL
ncbi:MAG: hypothetical protein ACE5D8_07825 [Fidelibacterota bacterium]